MGKFKSIALSHQRMLNPCAKHLAWEEWVEDMVQVMDQDLWEVMDLDQWEVMDLDLWEVMDLDLWEVLDLVPWKVLDLVLWKVLDLVLQLPKCLFEDNDSSLHSPTALI